MKPRTPLLGSFKPANEPKLYRMVLRRENMDAVSES